MKNPKLQRFVAEAISLCEPDSVLVFTDSAEDIALCRQLAIDNAEEKPLAMEGHTVHFDGPKDQARDKGRERDLQEMQGAHAAQEGQCRLTWSC